ncbi:MAG TPA: aminotransferase class III-fold pyridoxal phosphate-dependent enzyme [Flavipsychrobacter sp.]|nr:aminotransferase class III-fold pyridoxal phosphate-dependent enzyme [Flavipsychrobacter sp.]
MKLFEVYPLNDITIVKGSGSYVWDDQGQRYLDCYGGHAVISIGHCHPYYIEAIEIQLHQLGFYSNSVQIPLQQQLAEKLGAVSGKEGYQLFLCNSGAEANENAIKLASFHTGRSKVIAFSGSFHGRTSLAVAATDNKSLVAPVNETENVVFLPFNDVTALQDYFDQYGNETAAVIVEGIQGVGGIHVASDEFLQAVRHLCDEHGAVYIADSVQCGYGRSGKFFSHDYAGVNADIYSMAKGMGNGFPIGGIIIAPHIQPKYGMLGTTFGGNHLACAAALAVLDVIQQGGLLNLAHDRGEYLKKQLKQIDGIKNVRGKGLMIGFDVENQHRDLRRNLLHKQKIFTGEAKPNVIRILPALNIGKEEIHMLVNAVKIEIDYLNGLN